VLFINKRHFHRPPRWCLRADGPSGRGVGRRAVPEPGRHASEGNTFPEKT